MAGTPRVVGRLWNQTGDDAMRALVEEHNKLVTDVELMRAELLGNGLGQILTSPSLGIGTTSAAQVRNEAFTFSIRGSGSIAKAAAETSIGTGTIATAKERQYTISIQAGGTVVVTVGAEADPGLGVRPAAPSGELVLGWLLVSNASGGTFTGNTTLLNATDITSTFTEASVGAASALTAATVTTREAGDP